MSRFAISPLLLVAFASACSGTAGPRTGMGSSDGGSEPGSVSSGGSAAMSGGNGGGSGNAPGAGNAPGSGTTNGGAVSSGEPSTFTLQCSKAELGSPALRLLTRGEFQNTIGDIFPEVKGQWASSLPANPISEYGFDNAASTNVSNQAAAALLETATSVASALTGAPLANLLPCSTAAADRACAQQYLDKYGRRLFRRPLTQPERDRYLAFFDSAKAKADFKIAIKWLTIGLIQSPNAVYRSEIGIAKGDGTRQLTAHEIATELSYTYTGSTPSEDLLSKADAGSLGDPVATAKSLIATEPGKQAVQRFFEAYLGYTRVSSTQKIKVPTFDSVSKDMVQETRAFINEVVLQKGGGVKELLTATTTNPSQSLAAYYGFPAPSADYAAITRPAGRGIGIFAQGSFLATHANSEASSPTQRGIVPYLRLLCRPKLHVPDDAPPLAALASGQKLTTRQRYEEIHAKPDTTCKTCHRQWDPIGFGFEHFDEAGRYRADEGGLPINAAATVVGTSSPELFSFNGQEDLVTKLAALPESAQCFSAYLAMFAFGTNTSCLGAQTVSELQSGAIGITEAFARLSSAPHFTQRKAN